MLQIVWHGPRKSQIVRFVGHAYRPCLLHCFLLLLTTGLMWVGNGHQQIHVSLAAACTPCCNSQIDVDAVCGVCALESSSYVHGYVFCCRVMIVLAGVTAAVHMPLVVFLFAILVVCT